VLSHSLVLFCIVGPVSLTLNRNSRDFQFLNYFDSPLPFTEILFFHYSPTPARQPSHLPVTPQRLIPRPRPPTVTPFFLPRPPAAHLRCCRSRAIDILELVAPAPLLQQELWTLRKYPALACPWTWGMPARALWCVSTGR